MNESVLIAGLVVGAALTFDFINGFHDAANAIATIVETRVLKPLQAVLWASFFNFAALFLFSTAVAKTVGSGMISLDAVTPVVVLSGLIGAIVWGLVTWWFGIPTSSSHALLGGYAGAAMANSGLRHGWAALGDPLVAAGWTKTLIFIVIAPVLGFVIAQILTHAMMALQKKYHSPKNHILFGRLQLVSSAFLSLMHGGNDAQKTAGIIASAFVAAGFFDHFTIPSWVLWMSYATMALGTFFGGWRIVRTMGHDLTRMKTSGGFCAETAAGTSILLATLLAQPVSTTHATTGAILGVGAARNVKAVRWSLARNILWAWIFTIPAAALMGGVAAMMSVIAGL